MNASSRLEDYLESVFSIEISGEEATVTRLAEMLDLTKGTVTSGIKKLVKSMMLEHEPYGAVRLTEAGRQRALTIYRRHENLSFLFTDILGMKREDACELACVMEHAMDERTEQKFFALGEFFSRAKRHGEEWVHRLEQELENDQTLPMPLAMRPQGKECTIVRLSCTGPLRIRLLEMGLVPGTPITIENSAPMGGPIITRIRGMDLSLRRNEAASVWTRIEEENKPER